MPTVNASAVTDALEADLEELLPVPVGDGAAPDGRAAPYVVLEYLGSREVDEGGSWAQPDGLRWYAYQVTAVGQSRKAAEALCAAAHRPYWELPARLLTIAGAHHVRGRLIRDYGTTREGQVYNSIARLELLAHASAS